MKNIAFILNIVGLIILLPLVAVMQLHHGSNTYPNVEKTNIPANENVISKNDTFSPANNNIFF